MFQSELWTRYNHKLQYKAPPATLNFSILLFKKKTDHKNLRISEPQEIIDCINTRRPFERASRHIP